MALGQDVGLIELLRLLHNFMGESSAQSKRMLEDSKKLGDVIERAFKIQEQHKDSLEQQRSYVQDLKNAIEDAKKKGIEASVIRSMKDELNRGETTLASMEHRPAGVGSVINSIQDFSLITDRLSDAIGKWIDFNVRMQTMQIDAIKTGWENISAGQTPYMSKTLSILNDYSKRSLEIQGEQQKATIDIVAKVVGLVGAGVGGFSSGGMGAGVGFMMGTNLVTSFVGSFMELEMTKQKQAMNELSVYTEKMGFLNNISTNVRGQRRGLAEYLSSSGQGLGNVGGNLNSVYDIAGDFAGVEGFDPKDIMQTMKMLGMTKQFQGTDQLGMATNIKLMGKTTGLGEQDILSYLTELRVRLGTPLDQLTTSFGKLVEISDKFQMPLRQVMDDFKNLAHINQRYGYSQDELIGLYAGFIGEIKKGTIGMQDFQRVLEGMSQTSTEKAIGIGALLQSADRDKILGNVASGDRSGVSSLLSLIGGMGQEDVGMFLKMASQPNADKNPFMQQMMSKYGIGQSTLESTQPYVLKSLLGMSQGFGSEGGAPAINQMIFEAFGNMTGLGLSPDYYTQGQQTKMIGTLGARGNFSGSGFGGQIEDMTGYLQTQVEPMIKMELKTMQTEYFALVDSYDMKIKEFSGDVFKAFESLEPQVSEAMKRVSKTITDELERIIAKIERRDYEKGYNVSEDPDKTAIIEEREKFKDKWGQNTMGGAIRIEITPETSEIIKAKLIDR